jgi:membrane protease YdiL (CAAX protease family)
MSTAANSNRPEFTAKTAGQVTTFLIVWLLSTAAILAGVRTEIRRYSHNKPALSAVLIAFALQFAPYWLQGFPAIRKQLELHFNRFGRALLAGIMLLIAYIVYAAGTGTLNALAAFKLISITAFSLGIYALIPPNSQRLSWQDLTVMLIIAVPLYTGWYRDIWPFPVYLDVMARLFVVSLTAAAVLSVRSLEGVGYDWRIEAGDWLEGVRQLFLFSIIGLPLGFFLRFIAWHPRSEGIPAIGFSFLGIFLFIAIMEELFFRGVLQNLLEKSLENKYLARGIASAVFGLSHIYHGFPNWRYVIMAAIAGWFYGTAWHNRRNIMASSVVHASVDTIWRHFLSVQ